MIDADVLSGHVQELRRGTVVVACLSLLSTPGYGYALLDALGRAGLAVDANTLYPLLRRLEKQGLLDASWNTEESRPRKFYTTSPAGAELCERLLLEWRDLDSSLERLARRSDPPASRHDS